MDFRRDELENQKWRKTFNLRIFDSWQKNGEEFVSFILILESVYIRIPTLIFEYSQNSFVDLSFLHHIVECLFPHVCMNIFFIYICNKDV